MKEVLHRNPGDYNLMVTLIENLCDHYLGSYRDSENSSNKFKQVTQPSTAELKSFELKRENIKSNLKSIQKLINRSFLTVSKWPNGFRKFN